MKSNRSTKLEREGRRNKNEEQDRIMATNVTTNPTQPNLAMNGAAGIQHLVENNSRHRWICALARVVTAGGGWGLCHIMCEGGKLRDRVEAIFC